MDRSDNELVPDWTVYERMVGAIEAENLGAGIDFTATMNASLIGAISNTARQIDLLVEARWDDECFRRIIVDAKHLARRLTV